MKKIIMNLIGSILVELGLIITIGLMALVTALHYDTYPILCSVATIIGVVTIISIFWETYNIVLSFQILILHIQAYIDELVLRRILRRYIEENEDSEIIDAIIDEIMDEYLYK